MGRAKRVGPAAVPFRRSQCLPSLRNISLTIGYIHCTAATANKKRPAGPAGLLAVNRPIRQFGSVITQGPKAVRLTGETGCARAPPEPTARTSSCAVPALTLYTLSKVPLWSNSPKSPLDTVVNGEPEIAVSAPVDAFSS